MAKKQITTPSTKQPLTKLSKVMPWILILGGIIGIICSLVLIYDQIQIWENATYQPTCDINPVVSCGNVINSGEGKVFGLPAPLLGLVMFPALATVGVAMLAGAQFKRWFWQGLELGLLGGVAFAIWLFVLSLFRIKALCPFCLTVDAVVYTVFWYTTLYVIQQNLITIPRRLHSTAAFIQKHHLDILIGVFVILIAIILKHFWYFYGQYFS